QSLPPEDLQEDPAEQAPAPAASVREVNAEPRPEKSRWGLFLGFLLLSGAVVGALRMAGGEGEVQPTASGATTASAPVPAAPTTAAAPSASAPTLAAAPSASAAP